MPSLRIRACSVVRFMARIAAAPFGPAMRHSVWRSARRMCWRSASSRVEIDEVDELEEAKEVEDEESVPAAEVPARFAKSLDFSSLTRTRNSLPGDSRTARSIKF